MTMRLVEILIPKQKREAVEETLHDEGLDYTLVEEKSREEPSVVIAKDLTPRFSTYVVMMVLSMFVATAGLLLDSPAVVVGSMVIAPLIGPALGASVGTVINDHALFRRAIKQQAIGLSVGVVTATVFAFVIRTTGLVPPMTDLFDISEIEGRLTPDLLSLVIAIGAGVAGAWTLTAGTSVALVGVMMAVAVVPPLGVVGIGIAWGFPSVALAASVLVLVNMLTINITSLAVLWYKGYRPESWFQQNEARITTAKCTVVLAVTIIVLTGFSVL
nr:TIGR00341 family protein [Halovivax sp. KZCA124]